MMKKVGEYGLTDEGLPSLKDMPGKIWRQELPDGWVFVCNGNLDEREVGVENGMSCLLGPGDTAIFFNGWLAGIINIFTGEGVMASGEVANTKAFVAAVECQIERCLGIKETQGGR